MNLFPMFLKLQRRRCLVVGAGRVGELKIEGLLLAGATVHVVAPRATAKVAQWSRGGVISWEPRRFQPTDLDRVFLVVAATGSPGLHEKIYQEATSRGVLCNVVDDPEHCDFYYPAVVRRGQLQIAISTGGQSPALAHWLRCELETQFGAEWGAWVEELGEQRRQLFTSGLEPDRRREILLQLATQTGLLSIAGRNSHPGPTGEAR